MAFFSQLDDSNKVIQVIIVDDNELVDDDGNQKESKGIAFCRALFPNTNWKQTRYSTDFRKNFGGVNTTYDPALDAFITIKPFASWTLDEATCQWTAPAPYPQDGKRYAWDEATLSWVEITE